MPNINSQGYRHMYLGLILAPRCFNLVAVFEKHTFQARGSCHVAYMFDLPTEMQIIRPFHFKTTTRPAKAIFGVQRFIIMTDYRGSCPVFEREVPLCACSGTSTNK